MKRSYDKKILPLLIKKVINISISKSLSIFSHLALIKIFASFID